MKGKLACLIGVVVYAVAVVMAVIGWVLNIAAIVHMASDTAYEPVLSAVRILGIFFVPLGIVLGYF